MTNKIRSNSPKDKRTIQKALYVLFLNNLISFDPFTKHTDGTDIRWFKERLDILRHEKPIVRVVITKTRNYAHFYLLAVRPLEGVSQNYLSHVSMEGENNIDNFIKELNLVKEEPCDDSAEWYGVND